MSNERIIRDFIYLDDDRLFSLYSQVFEGVTYQVTQLQRGEERKSEQQKGNLLLGQETIGEVAKSLERTESKYLHHSLYNQLEHELISAILDASELTVEDNAEQLSNAFMIKARGQADLQDYGRLIEVAGKLGLMQAAVASAAGSPVVALCEQLVQNTQDKAERDAYKKMLYDIKKQQQQAVRSAASSQEQIDAVRSIIEVFHKDSFEAVVHPPSARISFRCPLETRFLRVPVDHLRLLYRGSVQSHWTMVGQVTHIPDSKGMQELFAQSV